MRHVLMLVPVMLLVVGCGESTPSGENVALDQVPQPVMKVAEE